MRLIYQDEIDFSEIKDEDVKGCESRVTLICTICYYKWTPSIKCVISGKGCPSCHGTLPWTLEQWYTFACTNYM